MVLSKIVKIIIIIISLVFVVALLVLQLRNLIRTQLLFLVADMKIKQSNFLLNNDSNNKPKEIITNQ